MSKQKKADKKKNSSNLRSDVEIDEHKIGLEELYTRLQTNPQTGLTSEVAEKRLAEYGKNALTPPKETPEVVKLFKTIFSGFSLLLCVAAGLCFISYGISIATDPNASKDNLYLACVLMFVVLSTGLFSYYQNFKSNKIMDSFKKMIPTYATVVRNGQKLDILSENLVPGDIVEIIFGNFIAADCRIIEAKSFKVDNSPLTGESEPQTRTTEFTHENPLETKNMIFFSTYALEGTARGLVILTGDRTVIGRIANLTTGLAPLNTPIAREINRLILILTFFAVTSGLTVFAITMARGDKIINGILFLIGIAVGNLPEGLSATLTASLTLTAKRLAGKNCLVKKLEAVETLGSTSIICSDKTGTLTQNKMTVAHAWLDDDIIEVDVFASEELSNASKTDEKYSHGFKTWKQLSLNAMLCNRAEFKTGEETKPVLKRDCNGDASETALLKCMELLVGNVMELRDKCPKVMEVPFNSTNKYQLSVHDTVKYDNNQEYLVLMKGAPERIIDRCKSIEFCGKEMDLTEELKAKFNTAYLKLGGMGERVLGFCELRLPLSKFPRNFVFTEDNTVVKDLKFVGLISMIDPPRPSVPEAVSKCRSAGIKVIMVTGDHPITAKAIAKAVGIILPTSKTVEDIAEEKKILVSQVDPSESNAIVIHGSDLKDMTDKQLNDVLVNYNDIVFARTSPQQKLIIVEGCQRTGAIVAVTGDGVNDSPALKKADIGVAMGITGSDVSKQAADMVLLDDNFSSIVVGVEEGRIIFDNLKKSIFYMICHSFAEILPFFIYLIITVPLPIMPITVICIDLFTDMLPSISLAYEPAESDIMKRKPRNPTKDNLVTPQLFFLADLQLGSMEAMAGFFCYFVAMSQFGFLPGQLINLKDEWENKANNRIVDSYGQEWSYRQRLNLQTISNSSYFMGVVFTQVIVVLTAKTRSNSLYFQRIISNKVLIFGIFFSSALMVFIIFCPGIRDFFLTNPIPFVFFFANLPFSLLLFCYEEVRKLLIRRKAWRMCPEYETYY